MLGRMSPGQRAMLAARGVRSRSRSWMDGVAVPTKPEELKEFLMDGAKVKAVLGDDPAGNLFKVITNYAAAQQGPGTDLHKLVNEQVTKVLAQQLQDMGADGKDTTFAKVSAEMQRLNLSPQDGGSAKAGNALFSYRQGAAYNRAAVGASHDNVVASFAEICRAGWRKQSDPGLVAKGLALRNALSSVSPSDGGLLIPEAFRSALMQMALERSVVRQRATVIPMDTLRVSIPFVDSTSNVSSVMGGMIGYWAEEGSSFTDSSAKFGAVRLEANKLTGYSAIPNELFQDSGVALQAFIGQNWPLAMSWFEDVAFNTGNGVGQPLGWQDAGNTALIPVLARGGQDAATIIWENIVDMYSRMLPSSLSSGVWIGSPAIIPQLYTMALSVGTGGAPIFMMNGAQGAPMTILGQPLVITEKAGNLGSQSDLSFVDLSYYLIGDRQAMSLDASDQYLFGSDKTAVRVVQRVDGRPWVQSPLTPAYNGSTLSPFVTLAAR